MAFQYNYRNEDLFKKVSSNDIQNQKSENGLIAKVYGRDYSSNTKGALATGGNMKVTLICPPHPYLINETQLPLGLLYIQAMLIKHGHEAEFINLTFDTIESAIEKLPKDSDVYGFTAYYIDYIACEQIAKEMKKRYSKAFYIIGGPHVTTLSDKINTEVFDSMFIREAEYTILDFMKDLEKFKKTRKEKDKPKKIYEANKFIENLDELPFPIWPKGVKTAQIMASRGCPFNCGYCASSALWKRVLRKRSIENVLEELKQMKEKYGIDYVGFNDDSIAIFRNDYLKKLCKGLKELGLKWSGMLRPHECVPETLKFLKDGECDLLIVGIESADQACLDGAQKSPYTTPEINKRAIDNINKAGIHCKVFFMIGLPGETMETVNKNIKFLDSTKCDGISLKSFTPLPGSPIWNNPKHFHIKIKEKNLSKYNFFLWKKGKDKPIEDAEIINLIEIEGLTDKQMKENKKRMREYVEKRNKILIGQGQYADTIASNKR